MPFVTCFTGVAQAIGKRRSLPIGPRAFDQRAPGVGVPGLGDTPLPPPLPRRVLRGREAEVAHQLPRGVEPREVS